MNARVNISTLTKEPMDKQTTLTQVRQQKFIAPGNTFFEIFSYFSNKTQGHEYSLE